MHHVHLLHFLASWLVLCPPVHSLQPIPKVKGSGETITIEAGNTLLLQCEVDNMPRRLKAKWERCKRFNSAGGCVAFSGLSSRGKVKNERDYGIRRESEIYMLYIYDIQPRQSGTYFCSVKTAFLAHRSHDFIHVTVYQKPVIDTLTSSSDVVARQGQPIRLNCAAEGSPEPLVIWQRAGAMVLPGGGFKRLNRSLEIASCDHRSRGTYMCAATNSHGEALRTITVDCLGAPTVLPASSTVKQMVGYKAKLVCTVESSPPATYVWWTVDGEDVSVDNPRYSVGVMRAALGRVVTRLIIVSGVSSSDYTTSFSCHAENAYGRVNASVSIAEAESPQMVDGRILRAGNSSSYTTFSYLLLYLMLLLVISVTS